jgi:hypothetical protein
MGKPPSYSSRTSAIGISRVKWSPAVVRRDGSHCENAGLRG